MSEVRSVVRLIIADNFSVDEAALKDETNFSNDLGADSLDHVELIVEFEKRFSIAIPDDEAEKIVSVGDAITYIENKMDKQKKLSELSR